MQDDHRHRVTAVGIVTACIISLLIVVPGLIWQQFSGDDTAVHVRWQWHFAAEVAQGTFYPRWLSGNNAGFGSPAFFFYPPMLQWFGTIFHAVMPGPDFAMSRLMLGAWLALSIGAIGTWRWCTALKLSARAAVFGAIVFALLPYHTVLDLYQRGAMPELTGIGFIPWMLAFATELKDRRPFAWAGLAISSACILFSHLPAADFGLLFAALYIALLALPKDGRFLIRGALAMATGALLASICIATALGLLNFIPDKANIWGARNQPVNFLIFGSANNLSHVVELIALSLVLGGPAFALAYRGAGARLSRIAVFLVGSTIVIAIANTEISDFFWRLQTPLSRIQFPFRLLGFSDIAVSGLLAMAFDNVLLRTSSAAAHRRKVLLIVPVCLLAIDSVSILSKYRHNVAPASSPVSIVRSDLDTGEYIIGDLGKAERYFADAARTSRYRRTGIDVVEQRNRYARLTVDSVTPTTIVLHQFAFSGWQCRTDGGRWVDGSAIPYPYNLPTCRVPGGTHRLEMKLSPTRTERAGLAMTWAGIVIVIISLIIAKTRPIPRMRPLGGG